MRAAPPIIVYDSVSISIMIELIVIYNMHSDSYHIIIASHLLQYVHQHLRAAVVYSGEVGGKSSAALEGTLDSLSVRSAREVTVVMVVFKKFYLLW
jgi:hypothetical protein